MTALDTTPKSSFPPKRKISPCGIDQALGAKLREMRVWRRRSQADLGKTLGVSFQQIQKYELGSNRLSAASLLLLAAELGVKPEWFFEGLLDTANGDAPPLIDHHQRRLLEAFDRIQDPKIARGLAAFIDALADGLAIKPTAGDRVIQLSVPLATVKGEAL